MKVNHDLVQRIRAGLSDWEGVEAFLHLPPMQNPDQLPGNPVTKIDIFYKGKLPKASQRPGYFPEAEFWEGGDTKDRFFLEGNNVHISYRSVDSWEDKWAAMEAPENPEDTYGLYRLQRGNIIWSRSTWIQEQKHRLEQLPKQFWKSLLERLLPRLEHLVSDMGIAVISENNLSFLHAHGRFLEAVVETLFALNQRFLPAPEEWQIALQYLPQLPSGFAGYWDSLLRDGLEKDRKWEIAKYLVKGLWDLSRLG